VISEDRAANPHALEEYFGRFPIDLLKIAPSHLAALQLSPHPERILPRRWLVIGGEVSRWDWMKKLQAMTSCAIFNHYGPTETTVGVLTFAVRSARDHHASSTVPIGRPLPNVLVYVLDSYAQPVPVGIAGEMHIGGSGVARGYLNRPELTAEKFIPNSFSDEPGARLYRTGDLARYLPDGNIEFLGRIDDQVKIRGFRVEPGEIESVLNQHSDVHDCVVVVRDDDMQTKRLIAYVVPKQQPSPTAGDLRDFLRQRLPDYAVPSNVVLLDALPRTPHGKIDRKALPAPEYGSDRVEYRPPHTPIEAAIADIWSELMKLPRVGIDDNFFDLGGHSLLAMQALSRVNHALGTDLTMRQLFDAPTVNGLALAALERLAMAGAERSGPR
jgi:acyl-coenzyme A synthetase/AMP-(fatty) acid ligase